MATKVRFSDTKEMAQAAAEQMVLGTDLNTFRSNLISSYAPAVGAGLKSHLGALQGVQSQVTEAKKTIQSDISGAYSTYLQNQMALARNQNLMAGYKANISDAYANAMALSKGTVADAYKAAEAAGAAGVAEQMSAWEGLKQQYNKSIEKTYGEAADVVAKEQKWATQAFDATIQALYDALGGNTEYFTDIGDEENELYTLSKEGEKLLFEQSDAAKGEFKLSELGKQLLAKQFGDTSTGMDKYFKASHLDDYDAEKSLAFKNALLGETWETDYEDLSDLDSSDIVRKYEDQVINDNLTKYGATFTSEYTATKLTDRPKALQKYIEDQGGTYYKVGVYEDGKPTTDGKSRISSAAQETLDLTLEDITNKYPDIELHNQNKLKLFIIDLINSDINTARTVADSNKISTKGITSVGGASVIANSNTDNMQAGVNVKYYVDYVLNNMDYLWTTVMNK